jgi:hypothetical protein
MNEDILQEILAGIYIQNLRIYDLLSALAMSAKQEEVEKILELHENGGILCPDPSLKIEDKDK